MNEQLSRSLETSESTNRSQRGQIRRSDYRKRSLTAMEEAAQRANNFCDEGLDLPGEVSIYRQI
jgi:hypothetical protein